MKKLNFFQLATLFLFSGWLLLNGSLNYHGVSGFLQVSEPTSINLQKLPKIPVLKTPLNLVLKNQVLSPAMLGASVSAVSALVYDINSGAVLVGKNTQLKFSPASTTKLMTALIALETYSPETLLKFDSSDFRFGFNHGFQAGEELTVKNLITAMLVESANEAAFTLARNYPTGETGFVNRMNEKAKELGLTQTHFTNPAGFDNPKHYSTATDLNKLALEATKNPLLADIVKLKKAEISDFAGKVKHQVTSTNKLLLYNPQVIGVKTGTTPNAKEVLITKFKLDDDRILQIIVMGSRDRYEDTLKLYDLALRSFKWENLGELIQRIVESEE